MNADAHADSHADAHAHSIKTTNSHPIHLKNKKNSKKYKKNNIIKNPPQEQKQECLNNHDSSDCTHESNNNPIKPKYSLNINKIKNVVNNVKTEIFNNTKIIPIEKKINIIIEKVTNKLQSELMKEYMNYTLILENSTNQNGSYTDKLNAFYHILLNKIDSKL